MLLAISESCENLEEDPDLTIRVKKVCGCENTTETEVLDWLNSYVAHHMTYEEIFNFVMKRKCR